MLRCFYRVFIVYTLYALRWHQMGKACAVLFAIIGLGLFAETIDAIGEVHAYIATSTILTRLAPQYINPHPHANLSTARIGSVVQL